MHEKYSFSIITFFFLRKKIRDFFIMSEIARRSKNMQCSWRFGQVKSKIYNIIISKIYMIEKCDLLLYLNMDVFRLCHAGGGVFYGIYTECGTEPFVLSLPNASGRCSTNV